MQWVRAKKRESMSQTQGGQILRVNTKVYCLVSTCTWHTHTHENKYLHTHVHLNRQKNMGDRERRGQRDGWGGEKG